MATVSVIVPVYNSRRFLREAVESVLKQTFTDWEMLLVDDGSLDGSAAIAAEYAREHALKIQLLFHPDKGNHGVSATRNRGIDHAGGQYLAFLDADDVWLPHRLEKQVPVLEKYPEAGLVYGLSMCVDEQSRSLTRPTGPFSYLGEYGVGIPGPPFDAYAGYLVGSLFAPVSTVLVRTHIVKECGGFALGLRFQVEDQVMWTQVARRTRFYFINETLALYRVHNTSWSSRQDALSQLDFQLEHLTRIAADDRVMSPLLADGLGYFILRYWKTRRIRWGIRIQRTWEILGVLRRHRQVTRVCARYLWQQCNKLIRMVTRPVIRRVRHESGGSGR
jgi:glycosyltransferase involved in cell wall biosynthesis